MTGSSRGSEITVVGDYSSPWSSDADEAIALNRGKWSPTTKTFRWLAINSKQPSPLIVDSVKGLLQAIISRPAGTIRRINIITHGNSNGIGFSGFVDKQGGVFFHTENVLTITNLWEISKINTQDQFGNTVKRFFIDSSGNQFTFHDVRQRFHEEAKIFIYACKVGIESDFAKHFAHIFGVEVHCFSSEIDYYIEDQGKKLLPKSLRVAKHSGTGNTARLSGVEDFHLLKPNIVGKTTDIVLPPDFHR